jgi:putative tryptophan/tyrosine transport system substrate-binding protein
MIVPASGLANVHRELIISLAARHRLPAVYPFRFYVSGGDLIAYGPIRSTRIGAQLCRLHP